MGGRARIASSLNEDEASAAQNPQTIQLHERVRLRAAAARERVQRLSNQSGFENIAATVDEFSDLVASDTRSVAANISTVWELSTAIGTFIERDDEVKAGRGGLTPQMDADAREVLNQLLIVAAPFVRRFPTAREHDEALLAFRRPPELIEPAKRIVEEGNKASLFEPHTEKILDVAIAAAERSEGVQAGKSRFWAGGTVRNVMRAFMVLVVTGAGAVAEGYLTKTGEHFQEHSKSGHAIEKFLLDTEKDAYELFSGLPSDVRAAMHEVLRRLREGKFRQPPTHLPEWT